MGEEQIQQEEQIQEEQVKEETKQTEEGPAVKILRQKLEQEIKTRKQLEEELENIVAKKYPELSDEIEDIMQFRRGGENIEDTILRYIGKKTIESKPSQTGFSLGSNKLTSNPSEPKGEAITKEQAEQLFKQLYYPEE